MELAFVLAYILMFLGLVGAVLPLLPGAPLIWVGALLWAWADGFERVGWPVLIVLALLALFAWTSDIWLTSVTGRRAGAGWKGIIAAIIGGLLGGIFLAWLTPIIGALVGSALGMLLVEYSSKHDWQAALQATGGYMAGVLLSSLLEIALCILMLAIFAWQAFA